MTGTYKSFSDQYPTQLSFRRILLDYISQSPSELFEPTNWFMDLNDLIDIIFNIFYARTFNKLFIWNTTPSKKRGVSEFDMCISGVFLNNLWSEFLNFYKSQLVLKNNDLKDLANYKNRGNLGNSLNQGAITGNARPTPKGHLWDNNLDAPENKRISQNDILTTNRINDMVTQIQKNLNIYFDSIYFRFEKCFFSKIWYKKCVGN